jgi:Rrf2 family protein
MTNLVSTKGRYALRVMLDLAENGNGGLIPLKSIAERQCISLKYMETIMPNLIKAGLVTATHGKGGGYKLSRPADQYTVGEILRMSEGSITTVACLENGYVCTRADTCKTLPIWKKLDTLINNYLDTVLLTDLLIEDTGDDYVI